MMRALILISAIAFAAADNAGVEMEQKAGCAVDGAESVSDAMDASMFIWASIARCGKTGETVKCEIAVSSAIGSLNSMVNLILKATDKCGALNTVNKACGLAMSEMTSKVAGITAISGSAVEKCAKKPDGVSGPNWKPSDDVLCVVNVKGVAKSFFKVVKSFLKLEKTGPCKAGDTEACAANALQILGAFMGVGEYLAGTVNKCSPPDAQFVGVQCSSTALRLTQELTTFSERAINVAKACAPQPPPAYTPTLAPGVQPAATARLYSNDSKVAAQGASSPTTLLLAAFLPVTAIVGFMGGRMYGNGRASRTTRELSPMTSAE
jgi:hypothetical protein